MKPANRKVSKKAASVTRCYLLELPGELRKLIYEYALYHPDGIPVNTETWRTPDNLDSALSKTCKQIQKDCDTLFHDVNTFIFDLQTYHRHLSGSEDWKIRCEDFKNFVFYHVECSKDTRFRQVEISLGRQAFTDRELLANLTLVADSLQVLRAKGIRMCISMSLEIVYCPHLVFLEIDIVDQGLSLASIEDQIWERSKLDKLDLPGLQDTIKKMQKCFAAAVFGDEDWK